MGGLFTQTTPPPNQVWSSLSWPHPGTRVNLNPTQSNPPYTQARGALGRTGGNPNPHQGLASMVPPVCYDPPHKSWSRWIKLGRLTRYNHLTLSSYGEKGVKMKGGKSALAQQGEAVHQPLEGPIKMDGEGVHPRVHTCPV
jgi:hypothetical protein